MAVLNEGLLAEAAMTHAGAVAPALQMPLALTGSAAGPGAGAGMQGMLLGHAGGPAGGPLAGALLPYMQNPGLQHAGNLARPMYPGAHLGGPQYAPQARLRCCLPEQSGAAAPHAAACGGSGLGEVEGHLHCRTRAAGVLQARAHLPLLCRGTFMQSQVAHVRAVACITRPLCPSGAAAAAAAASAYTRRANMQAT